MILKWTRNTEAAQLQAAVPPQQNQVHTPQLRLLVYKSTITKDSSHSSYANLTTAGVNGRDLCNWTV